MSAEQDVFDQNVLLELFQKDFSFCENTCYTDLRHQDRVLVYDLS